MNQDRRGETMRLGAFFHPTGNHVAAWLHPEAQIDAGTNFRHYAQITQTAERAKFDLMFVADAVAVRDGRLAALSRWPQPVEMTILASTKNDRQPQRMTSCCRAGFWPDHRQFP
jgi:hypothetical protein